MEESDALIDEPRVMCLVLIVPFADSFLVSNVFHMHEEGDDHSYAR